MRPKAKLNLKPAGVYKVSTEGVKHHAVYDVFFFHAQQALIVKISLPTPTPHLKHVLFKVDAHLLRNYPAVHLFSNITTALMVPASHLNSLRNTVDIQRQPSLLTQWNASCFSLNIGSCQFSVELQFLIPNS